MTSKTYELNEYQVLQVQILLQRMGYEPGPFDGMYGPRTRSAVIAFKKDKGLNPTPDVGYKTWAFMNREELAPKEILPWMKEAHSVRKLHEHYTNRWLRKWLSSDGKTLGDPAKHPWCGDFVETAIRLGLPDEPIPLNPYWALNWQQWGLPTDPTYGCIISIKRPGGGGHVAFLTGEDDYRYYCLGGNQSNRVSVAPIDKDRFTPSSFRWPSTFAKQPHRMPRIHSSEASSHSEA